MYDGASATLWGVEPLDRNADELRRDLATCCRILWMEGHGDGYLGHVSARLDGEEYLMKPSVLGIEEVRPEDLAVVDWQGRKVAGPYPLHGELPIHAEVYRARPDVGAVIHTHPLYATALAATGEGLVPINHDGAPFYPGVPVFADPTLIVDAGQGRAMAEALGRGWALLLKCHGIVAVGRNLPEALFHARALERAAQVQLAARGQGRDRGDLVRLTAAEAEAIHGRKQTPWFNHFWDYYQRKLVRAGLGF